MNLTIMIHTGGHAKVSISIVTEAFISQEFYPTRSTCQVSNACFTDIDECSDAAIQRIPLCTGAQSQCVNQVGSYKCTCPAGTVLTPTVLPDETVVTQCEGEYGCKAQIFLNLCVCVCMCMHACVRMCGWYKHGFIAGLPTVSFIFATLKHFYMVNHASIFSV